jgi:hypothetical protein
MEINGLYANLIKVWPSYYMVKNYVEKRNGKFVHILEDLWAKLFNFYRLLIFINLDLLECLKIYLYMKNYKLIFKLNVRGCKNKNKNKKNSS